MRDLHAMLFAANLVMIFDGIASGRFWLIAVNAVGAIVAFSSWLPYYLSDKKEAA